MFCLNCLNLFPPEKGRRKKAEKLVRDVFEMERDD